jgi:hypothetical protein
VHACAHWLSIQWGCEDDEEEGPADTAPEPSCGNGGAGDEDGEENSGVRASHSASNASLPSSVATAAPVVGGWDSDDDFELPFGRPGASSAAASRSVRAGTRSLRVRAGSIVVPIGALLRSPDPSRAMAACGHGGGFLGSLPAFRDAWGRLV